MPTYNYECDNCGWLLEVHHGFDETYTGLCQPCGTKLRRVFNIPVLSIPIQKEPKTKGLEMLNACLERDGKGGVQFSQKKAEQVYEEK